MFSDLVGHFDVASNRLYAARDARLKAKKPILDLVSGNVTSQGIQFPQDLLQKALRQGLQSARKYHPDSLGQLSARRAIQGFYKKAGLEIPAGQILLTPGTSLSYWYAFKLLANAGDEILFPQPSYPLFDAIAALCNVEMKYYQLRERERWEIDFDSIEAALTSKTKAIVLVSPHNPTGAVATADEVRQLADIVKTHGLAIISDEVFAPFLYNAASLARPAAHSAPLVLTMNGFSKMLALPGLKVGWMAVSGDSSLTTRAMKALAMIADTFLPVSEPLQAAVPMLLQKSASFQKTYQKEIASRARQALEALSQVKKLSLIKPEGGFYVTVNLGERNEENVALQLLKDEGLLVHPGYFYDVPGNHLVLSLVNRPQMFRKALTPIARRI